MIRTALNAYCDSEGLTAAAGSIARRSGLATPPPGTFVELKRSNAIVCQLASAGFPHVSRLFAQWERRMAAPRFGVGC